MFYLFIKTRWMDSSFFHQSWFILVYSLNFVLISLTFFLNAFAYQRIMFNSVLICFRCLCRDRGWWWPGWPGIRSSSTSTTWPGTHRTGWWVPTNQINQSEAIIINVNQSEASVKHLNHSEPLILETNYGVTPVPIELGFWFWTGLGLVWGLGGLDLGLGLDNLNFTTK